MKNRHPELVPDTLHGISVHENGDVKYFIAVFAQKELEDDREFLTGHFAVSIFAKNAEEAERVAGYAETDQVELVLLFDVKDTLRQAIEQDRKDAGRKGKLN